MELKFPIIVWSGTLSPDPTPTRVVLVADREIAIETRAEDRMLVESWRDWDLEMGVNQHELMVNLAKKIVGGQDD